MRESNYLLTTINYNLPGIIVPTLLHYTPQLQFYLYSHEYTQLLIQ